MKKEKVFGITGAVIILSLMTFAGIRGIRGLLLFFHYPVIILVEKLFGNSDGTLIIILFLGIIYDIFIGYLIGWCIAKIRFR